ncbi:diaminopropionate ammonia-lyase [Desulfobacula sp.]|uniref:diaminopropionate ammonia-lyase n=1 Tax=Desulfobacula sp. TaxID=2593537 RepID=UPI0025B919C8|nr:diaminopropionate ammonia-lyase [Desulfobacula sp.]MBC2704408.1 diaminopropionate ammonia-lyase [Desulfobacula sp.]
MKGRNISCQLNDTQHKYDPSLFNFANDKIAMRVVNFHKSLPNYKPTPLIRLSSLADKLGIDRLFVKDESHRFDLNAFKVLGASYAIAKVLGNKLNLSDDELTFERIVSEKFKFQKITFATATDGNHGRAVAWTAEKFGCKAVVYLPEGSSLARLNAIKQFGAEASIINQNYDDTVLYAEKMAKDNGWILLQDTSWAGYEKVPTYIMQGYFTLITECLYQEQEIWPTHVFLQAGVGSLAAAILACLCSFTDKTTPVFVVVEPQGAPCLYKSIKLCDGKPFKVKGDLPTIMAGLACGEPSHIGLRILNAEAGAFIKCSDDVARRGMRVLGNPLAGDQAIISGESGAVTLGLVYELLSKKQYGSIKDDLRITSDSKILLFSTEGDTDPEAYREIVWY